MRTPQPKIVSNVTSVRIPRRIVVKPKASRRRKLSVRDSVLLGWRYGALANEGYDDTTIRTILARGDAYADSRLSKGFAKRFVQQKMEER